MPRSPTASTCAVAVRRYASSRKSSALVIAVIIPSEVRIHTVPTYAYRIVNVFTQGRAALTGNPLCVFERAQTLEATRMQALALQFNLSETTFILPSERASARVRIFTPAYELPFAGHPTLGTAHVCRALGLGGDRITLEMTAGVITVRALGD